MKKNKKKKETSGKRTICLVIVSFVTNIIALAILMMKIFYPYQRIIAFIIYGVSWIIFFYALKTILFKKYKKNRQFLLKWMPLIFIFIGLLLTLWIIFNLFPLNSFEIAKADKIALTEKMDSDQIYAENYIKKLRETEKLLTNQIKSNSLSALDPGDKNKTRDLWRDYLSYFRALEEITEQYRYFYQINYLTDRSLNERSFMLAYSAFLANYSSSLNLVEQIEAFPLSETLLNEGISSHEIPENSYYKIQKGMIKPENIVQTVSGWEYMQRIKQKNLEKLMEYSKEDYKNIIAKTGKNFNINYNSAVDYFEKNMFKGWFPIQKETAKKIGDTKIPLSNSVFIDIDKIKQIESYIYPGDIFLQRRNWYLSNAGLPGFWKHTVIYIGSLSDLDSNFPPSDLTQGLKMSEYIEKNFPNLYEELKDNKKRTLEAESEGVVSFTLEKSMSADYAAVLRPKISQEEKIKALIYAFSQFGKPYDFDFDFLTDNSIVCSELYYKAYPMMGHKLRMVSGRMILSSNHIVQDFDEKYEKQQNIFDLIYFIDADEKNKKSFFSNLENFQKSWQRSETDVVKAFLLE